MSAAPVICLRGGRKVRLGDGGSPVGHGPQMTVQLAPADHGRDRVHRTGECAGDRAGASRVPRRWCAAIKTRLAVGLPYPNALYRIANEAIERGLTGLGCHPVAATMAARGRGNNEWNYDRLSNRETGPKGRDGGCP